MIDALYQESIDRALDDQQQRPRPARPPAGPSFSLPRIARAATQGAVGGGLAEAMGSAAEVVGAFGQVMGATDARPNGMFSTPTPAQRTQVEQANAKLTNEGVNYSNAVGDTFRARAKDLMPDPDTSHVSEQLVAGVGKSLVKAVGETVALGPAGPLVFGLDEGLTESDKLRNEGVDLTTRTKVGAVTGVLAGASVALPIAAPGKALATTGLVAAGGPGAFVVQNATNRAILNNAGYDKIANQYDPFDPVGLALSTVVPAAFGYAGARAGRIAKPLKTDADVQAAAKLTPAEQVHSDAYEASAPALRELEAAVKAEKRPEVRAVLQTELDKQTAAHQAGVHLKSMVEGDEDTVNAARVNQARSAIDESSLSPPGDFIGATVHADAVGRAFDQVAAGERVNVSDMMTRPLDIEKMLARLPEKPQPFEPSKFRGAALPEMRTGDAMPVRLKDGTEVTIARQDGDGGAAAAPGHIPNEATDPGAFVAHDAAGNEVGRINFQPGAAALESTVDAAFRRKGLGTMLYDLAERHGADLTKDPAKLGTVSPDALALRGARDARPEAPKPAPIQSPMKAMRQEFDAAQQAAPPAAADGKGAGPAAIKSGEKAGLQAASETGNTAADKAASAALDSQIKDIETHMPDLMVQLEGMDGPMPAGELLRLIKEQAEAEGKDADLVQVAANCLLRS